MTGETALNIEQIMGLIPHRYPFLLVDRVLRIDEDGLIATKMISASDPILQGHFPGKPLWPGVLITEGLAQAGCVFYAHKHGIPDDKLIVFAGIDKVRFRRPVVPGDILQYDVRFTLSRGSIFKFTGSATVNGERSCDAELMASIVNRTI